MAGKRASTPVQHILSEPETLVNIADLPKDFRKEIQRGVSTGWRCLDKYLQGLRPGEVTVVTADTGVGKTTFCTQLLVNVAMQGTPVWINSWEMRPEVTLRKLASVILRRPMKLQNFTDRDSEQLDEWSAKYKAFINPSPFGTDMECLFEGMMCAGANGVKVVMLDHLDYLVKDTKDKMHEAIDATMKALHEYALKLRMHLILICHPRQSMNSTEEVGMHMLKGSSSIKQYADNILILHRCARTDSSSDENKVKVRIAKNRMFGTEGVTYLFYQPQWDGYQELYEEDSWKQQ